MTKIIAFAGRKQSGKTTCSEYITSLCGHLQTKIYNFADPLKQDICINILGLSHEQCYGSDLDKNTLTHIQWGGHYLTAREVMQVVGTDILRTMYNNVWVNATINKIMREHLDLAIIADCRFPNEVESIKSAGGLVIKLNRNPYNSDHASEIALDANNYPQSNFDLVLNNNIMTIDEQNNEVYNFLKKKAILP
jgi:hypothetical protein